MAVARSRSVSPVTMSQVALCRSIWPSSGLGGGHGDAEIVTR